MSALPSESLADPYATPEVDRLAISIPEAARRVGLARGTVYALARRGEFPAVRAGWRWLVPLAALRVWMGEPAPDPIAARQSASAAVLRADDL